MILSFPRAEIQQGEVDNMTKKYQAPKLVEVLDATKAIQGGKIGLPGDAVHPMQPATTPGYPADE